MSLHFVGVLAEMDDHAYIGADKKFFLINGEVTFDLSEDQIDVTVKVGLSLLRSCILK